MGKGMSPARRPCVFLFGLSKAPNGARVVSRGPEGQGKMVAPSEIKMR
jgi:hypothetical protein